MELTFINYFATCWYMRRKKITKKQKQKLL